MKTVDYFARLRSQLTSFLFINGDGLTVSRLGLSITLFFKQGYTQEKKQCVLACYRRFREEFGTHLRFHRHELKGLKKYSPENIAKVEEGMTRFMAWLDFLCEQLEPDSGDCGYCSILPKDYYDYFPLEYQLAQRYPSLQVNSAVHTAKLQYEHSIRGIKIGSLCCPNAL